MELEPCFSPLHLRAFPPSPPSPSLSPSSILPSPSSSRPPPSLSPSSILPSHSSSRPPPSSSSSSPFSILPALPFCSAFEKKSSSIFTTSPKGDDPDTLTVNKPDTTDLTLLSSTQVKSFSLLKIGVMHVGGKDSLEKRKQVLVEYKAEGDEIRYDNI